MWGVGVGIKRGLGRSGGGAPEGLVGRVDLDHAAGLSEDGVDAVASVTRYRLAIASRIG